MTFKHLYPFVLTFSLFLPLFVILVNAMVVFLIQPIIQNFHPNVQASDEKVILPFHTFLLMLAFLRKIINPEIISLNT